MPLTLRKLNPRIWYTFTLSNLELVPDDSGVYWLGVNNEIIYIGSSANLNERLTDHYYTSNPCISKARQFAIEICSNYRERERELLQAYLNQYGRLPECNNRIP
jgi:excinuclease UvrABC nuclease subunit